MSAGKREIAGIFFTNYLPFGRWGFDKFLNNSYSCKEKILFYVAFQIIGKYLLFINY